MRNEKGFTLIELLIVVAIIGIIAAIAIPSLLNALDRARQTTTIENIKTLGQGVEQYIMDWNRVGCPKSANVTDLQNIFEVTEINLNKSAVKDGWGADIIYTGAAAMGARLYTLMSYGSDAQVGPAVGADGIITLFTQDPTWVSGRFTARPEGAQLSGR
jgi:type II secretion system protein G